MTLGQAGGWQSRWWLALGIAIGLAFLFIADQEAKWFGVLWAGLLIGFLSLAFGDKKDFFLLVLVLCLPINIGIRLYYQPSEISRSTYGFQILLAYLPLLALYAVSLIRSGLNRQEAIRFPPGALPLLLLWLSALFSVSRSVNPLYGFFDLFALSCSILLYLYVATQIKSRRELTLVLVLLAVNVGSQGAIAWAQHLTDSNLGLDFLGATKTLRDYASLAALSRAGGTLGHPNSLALFFDLLLPLTFSLLFLPWRFPTRLLLAVLFLLGLTGLVVTLSRGGMLAVGGALILLLYRQLRRRLGRPAALAYVALVLLVGGIALLSTDNPVSRRFFRHDYGTAYGRLPHMQVALNLIRTYPFFGVGLNNYLEVAPQFDTTPQRIISLWQVPVHNLYLYILGEIGLVGFLWVVLFWLTVLRALAPAWRAGDPYYWTVGGGLLAGLLAYFFHVQFDYGFWQHFTTLWFTLGLAAATGRLAQQEAAA